MALRNWENKGNEDFFGYYKWKEIVNLYLDLRDKYPDRFALLRYEDAVSTPQQTIPSLFEFPKIPVRKRSRIPAGQPRWPMTGVITRSTRTKASQTNGVKNSTLTLSTKSTRTSLDSAGQFLADDRSGPLLQAPPNEKL